MLGADDGKAMTTGFDDICETALAWHEAGRGAALATVIETWGSAPRPVGSQLAVNGDGEMAGSVSGGCVEGAVVLEAQEALADGAPRLLEYGVSDDEAFAVGLACGGRIRILVEPVGPAMPVSVLSEIVARRAQRRPVAYVVDCATWDRALAGPEDPALRDRFRSDRSGFDEARFVTIFNPPLRMAIVGAVHIAQPLVEMAALAGFDVTLIDPRESFATASRFPARNIVTEYPDVALAELGLDARCAVVTLSHDPKIDDPAIVTALNSDVFYLGCLGSTRTHAKRLARLAAAGLDQATLARIHAPVGLDIGAMSPAEIAVAILAEVIAALRRA